MMRLFRSVFFFVVGIVLGGFSVFAFADYWDNSHASQAGVQFSSADASCAVSIYADSGTGIAYCERYSGVNGSCDQYRCKNGALSTLQVVECLPPKIKTLDGACVSCPAGTHNVAGKCEKDCFGDQKQSSDGSCKCDAGNRAVVSQSYVNNSANGCVNGCSYILFPVQYCPKGVAAALNIVPVSSVTCYGYATSTGGICGDSAAPNIPATLKKPTPVPPDPSGKGLDGVTPDPKNKPENNIDPAACGAAGGNYLQVGGVGKCVGSAGVPPADQTLKKEIITVESSSTDKNGNTTKTTEQTITSSGGGSSSTTKTTNSETKDAGGNTIGSGSSSGTSEGPDKGDGEDKGDCTLEPDAPYCKQGTVKDKGKFGDGQNADLEAAKGELRAKFAEIKAQAQGLLNGQLGGNGGSLPCYAPINIFGSSYSLCFTQYSSALSVIGSYLLFAATLVGVFIVLRR